MVTYKRFQNIMFQRIIKENIGNIYHRNCYYKKDFAVIERVGRK